MLSKVLFLDIDGVLNSGDYFRKRDKEIGHTREGLMLYNLDQTKVKMLDEIVKETNCIIVLSSTWRIHGLDFVNDMLQLAGLNNKILYATENEHKDRGEQITNFINSNPMDSYLVIDDDEFDISRYITEEQFVKTNWNIGMEEAHKKRIIKYFNNI